MTSSSTWIAIALALFISLMVLLCVCACRTRTKEHLAELRAEIQTQSAQVGLQRVPR